MKERPILFSGPMVRALLEGRKTQTRRVVKNRDHLQLLGLDDFTPADVAHPLNGYSPYGFAGDRLWVREAHALPNDQVVIYRANWREDAEARGFDNIPADDSQIKWRPSIHMPRSASRITLTITGVRIERLQAISPADAIAEGLYKSFPDDADREWFRTHYEDEGRTPTPEEWAQFEEGVWMVPGVPQGWGMSRRERDRDTWAPSPEFAYRLLWEHINGPASWAANPWVWVVEFERVQA